MWLYQEFVTLCRLESKEEALRTIGDLGVRLNKYESKNDCVSCPDSHHST